MQYLLLLENAAYWGIAGFSGALVMNGGKVDSASIIPAVITGLAALVSHLKDSPVTPAAPKA